MEDTDTQLCLEFIEVTLQCLVGQRNPGLLKSQGFLDTGPAGSPLGCRCELLPVARSMACSGWSLALRALLPGDQGKVASDRVSISRSWAARCFPAPVLLSFCLHVRTSSADSVPVFSIRILGQEWTFIHFHVPITISKALSVFCSFFFLAFTPTVLIPLLIH